MILLVWHAQITQEVLDSFPRLKCVIRYGVGYDAIDVDAAARRGIAVCNTPDYCIDEVSDTALAMLLSLSRRVARYDALCRGFADTWQENALPDTGRTSDLTVGVVGAGRIGSALLSKARSCGYRTAFYDPYKESGFEKVLRCERATTLTSLLQMSNAVSLHVPLNDETHAMVNREFVNLMNPGTIFINTSRGKVVSNLDVIYDGLESGRIESAALDVLPDEPPGDCRLITAWRRREPWLEGRLLLNPHVAFHSAEAVLEMRTKAAQNALRVLQGKPPRDVVNPQYRLNVSSRPALQQSAAGRERVHPDGDDSQ